MVENATKSMNFKDDALAFKKIAYISSQSFSLWTKIDKFNNISLTDQTEILANNIGFDYQIVNELGILIANSVSKSLATNMCKNCQSTISYLFDFGLNDKYEIIFFLYIHIYINK